MNVSCPPETGERELNFEASDRDPPRNEIPGYFVVTFKTKTTPVLGSGLFGRWILLVWEATSFSHPYFWPHLDRPESSLSFLLTSC